MARGASRCTVVAVALLATAGCGLSTRPDELVAPEDQALARDNFDHLRRGRLEEVERAMDASLQRPDLRGALERMAAAIPPGEPTSATVVAARRFQEPGSTTTSVTHEYGFDGQWVVVEVTVRKQAGGTTIVGFRVAPQPAPLAEQHRFDLRGKSLAQYLILGLAIGLPVFTIYALAACVRSGLRGRGWLWLPFVAVGVGRVAVNWTTGAVGISPVYVQLFSASAIRDLFGPWVISVSFPLGGVMFLLHRRRTRLRATAAGGEDGAAVDRVPSAPDRPAGIPSRPGSPAPSPEGGRCPRCGAHLPMVGDVHCPECRQPLSD